MPPHSKTNMTGTYLVTGASKGLGLSISLAIASSGNSVIALARNSSELSKLEIELQSLAGRVAYIKSSL